MTAPEITGSCRCAKDRVTENLATISGSNEYGSERPTLIILTTRLIDLQEAHAAREHEIFEKPVDAAGRRTETALAFARKRVTCVLNMKIYLLRKVLLPLDLSRTAF